MSAFPSRRRAPSTVYQIVVSYPTRIEYLQPCYINRSRAERALASLIHNTKGVELYTIIAMMLDPND